MACLDRLCALTVLLALAAPLRADVNAGLDAVVRRDWAGALAQFQPLADQGDADAQVNLGNLYMKGLGVPRDYPAAFRWYLKAAEQGNAVGQGKLGLLHYYGLGVPEDHGKAVRWFRKAAEHGENGARAILGSFYATGDGVEKDKAQAYFWYSLAAGHGNREALASRDALVEEMSPGEINDALDRLTEWQKRNEPSAQAEVDKAPTVTARKAHAPSHKASDKRRPGRRSKTGSQQSKTTGTGGNKSQAKFGAPETAKFGKSPRKPLGERPKPIPK